jgi:exodeoxyribonuclease VII large subunit
MGLEAKKPDRVHLSKSESKGVSTEGGGSDAPKTAKFFSITQYNRSVERLLKTQVPQVWVKGVITQLNVRGKIAYITLGEFEEGDTRPRAVLEVTLWSSELEVYNLRFAKLPIPLNLRVELKVALQLEANFYVPSGRFQPRVTGIDENFTLGELSLTRQRTLERLLKEGLLNRNKSLSLSDWPLRIGLITAPGSAAYQDFTSVLLNSGFSFRISFAAAKMQGEATESTVLAGLNRLQKLPLDVICIVRGGGSKTDLVYFDSENICRAIALCPIPVLTGIGHEIDNSLADLVAYSDKITPTDCAKFLEQRLGICYAKLTEIKTSLCEAWRLESQQNWHEMAQRAIALKHNWEGRKATEDLRGKEQARTLASLSRQLIKVEWQRMGINQIGLMRGPSKLLRLERLRFLNRTQAMGHAWNRLKVENIHRLATVYARLRDRSSQLSTRQKEKLTYFSQGLKTSWRQHLANCLESLDLKTRLVKAADPVRLLDLGFSLLRNRDGKLITMLSQVPPDGLLYNQLKDGTVESRVLRKEEKT